MTHTHVKRTKSYAIGSPHLLGRATEQQPLTRIRPDSEQSSYLDEETLDQLSTSPITFAHTPPAAGEDDEVRRNSFVVPIGHDIQLRRGSVPMLIPETPRPKHREGMRCGAPGELWPASASSSPSPPTYPEPSPGSPAVSPGRQLNGVGGRFLNTGGRANVFRACMNETVVPPPDGAKSRRGHFGTWA